MEERKMWYRDMCFYQIWPRSFKDGNGDGVGDLWGVMEKLDYIQSLNVDGIWFSPLYPSPNADYGYDVADYMNISPEYGDLELFKALLDAVHQRGMKLIMDLVVNHTSTEHPWFQASRRREEPYTDYYIWREAGSDGKLPNNWQSLFEGDAWEWDEERREYYLHIFAKKQADLNWQNPAVREEIKKILRFWLDLGVDGFREDVITFISKPRDLHNGFPLMPSARGVGQYNHGQNVHGYLQELRRDVLNNYDCVVIGESPMTSPDRALEYMDGPEPELDMMIQFDCMHGDCFMTDYIHHPFLLPKQKLLWNRWQKKLADKGWNFLYLENHDHPRIISRYGSESFREASGKALAASYLFQKGTPFIYQGQEIGMTNIRLDSIDWYEDVQTRHEYEKSAFGSEKRRMRRIWNASRESARTPMQWDDANAAGFTEGTPWFYVNQNYRDVNVSRQEEDSASLLNFYRHAIELRKKLPLVKNGAYRDLRPWSFRQYVYERTGRGMRLLVICSYSARAQFFKAPRGYDLREGKLLLSSHGTELRGNGFPMEPYECRVYFFNDRARLKSEKETAGTENAEAESSGAEKAETEPTFGEKALKLADKLAGVREKDIR